VTPPSKNYRLLRLLLMLLGLLLGLLRLLGLLLGLLGLLLRLLLGMLLGLLGLLLGLPRLLELLLGLLLGLPSRRGKPIVYSSTTATSTLPCTHTSRRHDRRTDQPPRRTVSTEG
jgi:hypothetical protein